MKTNLFIVAALAAATLVACGPKSYVISGSLEGLEGVVYLLDDNREVVDSAAVVDGAYSFAGKVVPGYFFVSDVVEGRGHYSAALFLEAGNIGIEGNMGSAKASGTPLNDGMNALSDGLMAIREQMMAPGISTEAYAELDQQYDQLIADTYEANKANLLGAYLVVSANHYAMSGQELLDAAAILSKKYADNKFVQKIQELGEGKVKTDPGQPYIEVSQPDAEGNAIALSSVVENPANKYVLLDFWASWCRPCMGEVPYLKAAYAEYHCKGFEIYGVSYDTARENWVNCVAENEMAWIHVSELNRFNTQAGRDYAVNSIPSNFLISCADGTIVARNLRGEALAEKLAELLADCCGSEEGCCGCCNSAE